MGIPEDALMLLVFGGSLGARHLNSAIASLKDRLLTVDDLYIMHVTGPKELETVEAALDLSEAERARYQVLGYQDHMGEAMAACDMVVSRAGATSLAEISARRIPALLVPFPYATADHQTTNAKAYVERGASLDDRGRGRGIGRIRYAGVRSYRQRNITRFHAQGGGDL